MDRKNDDGKSKRLYLWRRQQNILRRISLNFSSNTYLKISEILSMIYKYQNSYATFCMNMNLNISSSLILLV